MRSMRLLALCVAALVGVAALTVLGAPAGAAGAGGPAGARGRHTWTTIEKVVPVRTGPNKDIRIGIDTTLYVPDNASPAHPQPAILMTHGFGLTKDSTEVVDTARFFASHGYLVLTYTSSGFGDSGGCVTLQSADYDVKSASQVITKVLGPRKDVLRDRHGPVVGTIGGSYGGGIQLPLAAADPRIRTSVVGRTWNNLAYSLDPNNRVVPGDLTGFKHQLNKQGVFKQQWTSLFYTLGNAQPAQGNGSCPQTKQKYGDPTGPGGPSCPGYYVALCTTYDKLTSTGDADKAARQLLKRAAASTFIRHIDIPVLLVQGQSDTLFNLNDAVATYQPLHRRGVPVGMIWNSGGHGGYSSQPGECEVYDGKARTVKQMNHCYLTLRSLHWMDHWLRGTRGGRGPTFAYYRDWVKYDGHGADDEQYGTSRRFPLRHHTTTFTLSADGRLVPPGRTPQRGNVTFINPPGGQPAAYSETSNETGPDSSPGHVDKDPQEIDGQNVMFTSPKLEHAVQAVGIPSATVPISNSNGRDMVFFAKVYDVAPDGSTELIHRLIAPVRVPAGESVKPTQFKLAGFAHRFGKGHRVRLVLCSTDQTSYNSKVADVLTVQTGRGATFTLPGRLPRR